MNTLHQKSNFDTCINRAKIMSTKIVTLGHLGKIIRQAFVSITRMFRLLPLVNETSAAEVGQCTSKVRWPTRDTLSPCKSIAAPWKLTCSVHFRLFSVQIYRCSVQNRLLHTNIRSFSVQNRLLHTNIRSFSVQKFSFSVENSIFLRTNQTLLHEKFDVSKYKSKVFPCKIRCFSVQIESDLKLLRGKLHSELGDLGSPRPTNR